MTTPIVLCDVSNAQCTYVTDCTDMSLWNDKFITALSIRLAMNICGTLVQPEAAAKKLEYLSQLYQAALPQNRYVEEGWISDADDGVATRLIVYNMALRLVGVRMVSSIWEDMPEAVQCGVYWDRARRSALRDYPYRFAQRRYRLVSHPVPDVYSGEWRFCYDMPDVLKLTRVHGGDEGKAPEHYAVEQVGNKKYILCNINNALATCTVDVEDMKLWDDLFIDVMAKKLAVYIAPALQKGEFSSELAAMYLAAIPASEGQSNSEGRDSRLDIDSWLAARCS